MGRLIIILLGLLLACSKESNDSLNNEQSLVYICNGFYSKSYHYDPECQGLRSCTTEIVNTTLASAEKKGRTLCGYEQ